MIREELHRQFEKQVEQTPDETAIVFNEERLTYSELNRRANRVARRLRRNRLKEGDIVAVAVEDSPALLAGILGVLKAGGVYLPLEPGSPPLRAAYILRHSRATQLLKAGRDSDSFGFSGKVLALDDAVLLKGNGENLRVVKSSDRPFALSYQSDSTGRPEGVVISQESIANWAAFNIEQLKIDFRNTLFVSDSTTGAAFPLWLVALAVGGTVYFHRQQEGSDLKSLSELASSSEATAAALPLSLMGVMNRGGNFRRVFTNGLKNIVSVGDGLVRTDGLREYLKEKNIRWHNYFGFPEMQVVTTLQEETSGGATEIKHIGRPVSGTRAFIINEERQPAPVGVVDDLYLAGEGLLKGYYQHQELNRQRFVENSFDPGSEMYRTGYKASWLQNKLLAFHSDSTNRVYIGGVRLALEEIEAALNTHDAIDECAVVTRVGPDGEPRLTAYLVINEPVSVEELQSHLRKYLPASALSIGFLQVSSLPRAVSGAPDRKRLQELELLDTLDAEQIKESLEDEAGVDGVAVLLKEEITRRPAYHLKKLMKTQVSTNGNGHKPALADKKVGDEDAAGAEAMSVGAELKDAESRPKNLKEMLYRAARNTSNGITYVSGSDASYQSYGQLIERARRVGSLLKAKSAEAGKPAIIQLEDNQQFLAAFWACILEGIVPVPLATAPSYEQESNATRMLENVWQMLESPLVITDSSRTNEIKALLERAGGEANVVAIEEAGEAEAGTAEELKLDEDEGGAEPDTLALMLFTSGSTGKPKGVQLSHGNLISRSQATAQLNSFTSEDVSLNWMPLTHVGGIVMFHLRDVFTACKQIQVPISEILAEPLRWLDLIDKYEATVTWAPNFAYGLVNEELERARANDDGKARSWNLSRMRFILNGGEAINAATSKKFLQLLGEYGLPTDSMHPAWGMSETSSGVAYSELFTSEEGTGVHTLENSSLGPAVRSTNGASADSSTFVEVGLPIPGTTIRIVDADGRVAKEETIGHVQIKGLTVTSGYYNNPELNERVFVDGGWFVTGDLGFLSNGRLTITGREKDVIIINGINYYSHEIEAVVEEIPGVQSSFTAACAIRKAQGDTDAVAIFMSTEFGELGRQARQINEIRHLVTQKIGITPDYIIPVNREQIPKTSIGKIQRSKLSEQFAAGDFDQLLEQVDVALENERTLPAWFFRKEWRQEAAPKSAVGRAEGVCLLFADKLGLGESLSARLEADGHRVFRVEEGREFSRAEDGSFTINYKDAQQYRRVIETLNEEGVEVDDIIHLANYTGPREEALDLSSLKAAQDAGLYSLLYLVQSVAAGQARPTRLFVATTGAEAVSSNDTIAYEKTTISGLLKSLPLELSWLRCAQVDLEGADAASDAERIYSELDVAQSGTTTVAYRQGRRFSPYLTSVNMAERGGREIPIERGGIYLITGGLGGVGVHVASWLMKQYEARLIIVGRTSLPERSQWKTHLEKETVLAERIRNYMALEATGGEFLYEAGDVSDHSFLNDVVTRAESEWEWGEPIAGIFHLAGTLSRDGHPDESHWDMMQDEEAAVISRESVESQLRAKVYGTQALAPILEEREDAILVAFSSVNSFFGGTTLSAYSAANSFLEGFCLHQRQQKGKSVYCLSWSMWDDTGIARDIPISMKAASRSAGYEAISAVQGLNSLAVALSSTEPQVYVGLDGSNRNIRRFIKDVLPEKQTIKVYYSVKEAGSFDEQAFQGRVVETVGTVDKKHRAAIEAHRAESIQFTFTPRIGQDEFNDAEEAAHSAALEAGLLTTEVEKELARIWQDVLGQSKIGANDNFFAMGGHSLLATKLLSRISTAFQVEIPLRALFESPTIRGLAARIERVRRPKRIGTQATLQPIPRGGDLPLSFSQQRLWFLDQMQPGNAFYNMPAALRLKGQLDLKALERSLEEIVERHEALRTVFPKVDGKPSQVIFDKLQLPLAVTDLSDTAEDEREQEAVRLATEEVRRPFDLGEGPLFRASLLKLSDAEHILTLTMHHIVSDGWSVGIFARELITLYEAYSRGEEAELPKLPVQYVDFASWQRDWLQGDVLEKQLSYWKPQLAGRLPVLQLPTDRPRPLVQSFKGATRFFELPESISEGLNNLSREEGATLYMTLLAAFKTLLYQYSRQEEIIVGTPVANRRQQEVEELIGFFVNSLVLRTDCSGNPDFRTLLQRVREVSLGAFAHQDMPFEYLVEMLRPERDLSHSPLFQVMFVLQNAPREELKLAGLDMTPLNLHAGTSKFDLTLSMEEAEGKLLGSLEYNTDLFDDQTITRMLSHFESLLEEIAADPSRPIARLPRSEQSRLVFEWNQTGTDVEPEQFVQQLFERQSKERPDSIAVARLEEQLTYGELNARANQLAHYLKKKGVGPDVSVAVCVERSVEMLVAFLGILKAGGNYVPLDHYYPKERLAYMLKDSRSPVLLTQERLQDVLPEQQEIPIFRLDADWEQVAAESEENPASEVSGSNLAYVIYTSGSTGQPKGVEVSHSNLMNLVEWHRQAYEVGPEDRATQVAVLSFDASVWEIWPYLVSGAGIYLPDDETRTTPSRFLSWLDEQKITLCFLPTPLAEVMLTETLPESLSLRAMLVGGDKLHRSPKETLPFKLVNHYGPTESTVVATFAPIETGVEGETAAPPIGRPISNTRIYLLDQYMEPVPVGVAGEIFIGGASLARGYHLAPAMTAEKFIPDAFSGEEGARLYRTGDLARYLPDGNLEFLGRLDHQVKIRGYRIELGEIEAVLSEHPSVGEVIVIARADGANKTLVAYLVPCVSEAPSVSDLRAYMRERLPEYMVPSAFVVLSALPLTASGKVDVRALPGPEGAGAGGATEYVEPRTETEKQVAAIWQELLQVEKVGIHDNFFEIGGHSLLMVQAQSKLQDIFNRELTTIELFQYPTVHTLANFLDQGQSEQPAIEESQNRAEVRRASMEQRRQAKEQGEQSLEGDVQPVESTVQTEVEVVQAQD